ncbi:TerD family protein [Streptomyces sp. NPDC059816]|uniref:TerD family protein n=1 Tax=Streptomyces sp. NPDC059816 TaxID=3346960 RepID=UPI00365BE7CF
MTAELVRGQNHPLTRTRLEVRVSAGGRVVVAATLGDASGRVLDTDGVAHPGAPSIPGLETSPGAAADHRLALDLEALPDTVHRVHLLLALPRSGERPAGFGALPAPFTALVGPDGTELVSYTVTGLGAESAVVALEIYRRRDAWKVRAVGQGYAGGLVDLFGDQGLPGAAELAAAIDEAVARSEPRPTGGTRAAGVPVERSATVDGAAGGSAGTGSPAKPLPTAPPARNDDGPIDYTHRHRAPAAPAAPPAPTASAAPVDAPGPAASPPPPSVPSVPSASAGRGPVAGDAAGWSPDERLYNQVWGMFEDLARSVSAYRSAVDFAESRREQELDRALADPHARIGGASDAARESARAKYVSLVDRARAVLDRDLAQLTAESAVVETALPAAFARWDNAVWQAYRAPDEAPMALRMGDLHLPEADRLRIPMLVRLPLERGLWIDSGRLEGVPASSADGDTLRRLALETAVAHAARMLAAHPPGQLTLHVIDAAGAGTNALAPLLDSGVLAAPPARGAHGVNRTLEHLTRRVDLVQMALRNQAVDALPDDLDTARQLLILHDFPHGFDDRAVTRLRYLADEGPEVGVHLLMVADREDAAAYGPLLDPLWRSLLRLTPVPDDHLADPWVGHAWTYEPLLPPSGGRVLHRVLAEVAAARRTRGS